MGICTKKSLSKYNLKTLQNQKNINKFTTYIYYDTYIQETKKKELTFKRKLYCLVLTWKILRETFYKELYTILFTNINNEEKKGKNLCGF
jgi:hypothetical protein